MGFPSAKCSRGPINDDGFAVVEFFCEQPTIIDEITSTGLVSMETGNSLMYEICTSSSIEKD